jgi:preprotein translocase subunit SecB
VAISDLVTKGGFQQLVLQPVDFGALYNQRLQEARENTAPAEIPEHGPS